MAGEREGWWEGERAPSLPFIIEDDGQCLKPSKDWPHKCLI